MDKKRCVWVDGSDIYRNYHDTEWGRAVHNDDKLFEALSLEIFQSGLSWLTILRKREDFRLAFDNFKPEIISKYVADKVEELLVNDKIIRHKGKIEATINNAKRFIAVQERYGSFDKFIWHYVLGNPIKNRFKNCKEIPTDSELSNRICKDLKGLGFKFIGSKIIYSYMQAIGLTNDHTQDCFLYKEK